MRSCAMCNGRKGEQVALGAVRFFDPRHDYWPDHFTFLANSKYLYIEGVSLEGRATELGLGYNEGGIEGPLGTRHNQIMDGNYPPVWARTLYNI